MKLQAHHLSMLVLLKSWAPPANQFNLPPLNPVTLSDLFDSKLLLRNDTGQLILTPRGEHTLQAAVDGMNTRIAKVPPEKEIVSEPNVAPTMIDLSKEVHHLLNEREMAEIREFRNRLAYISTEYSEKLYYEWTVTKQLTTRQHTLLGKYLFG